MLNISLGPIMNSICISEEKIFVYCLCQDDDKIERLNNKRGITERAVKPSAAGLSLSLQ